MATLGQIALCVTLLLTKRGGTRSALPLSVFLLAGAVVMMDPVMANFMPSLRLRVFALSLPAYLIMAPSLWLYVEALTLETPWTFTRKHILHLIPFALGLIVSGLVITLPQQTLERLFIEEDLGGSFYLGIIFTVAFMLILGLIAQSAFYLVKIFRRLTTYRLRIKSLFADIEHRELFWLYAVLIFIILLWVLVALSIISENFFDHAFITRRTGAFMGLGLVWFMGAWGLRQVPGFENRYSDIEDIDLPEVKPSKYKRSALAAEQALRIAKKIEAAMRNDKLFLDSNLSLPKLANHIRASANHVSQTLNEKLGMSFFDYVNKWRIEEAKPKILLGEDTVLNIALATGFNSSSSFYKAFKKETGKTPRSYRKVTALTEELFD